MSCCFTCDQTSFLQKCKVLNVRKITRNRYTLIRYKSTAQPLRHRYFLFQSWFLKSLSQRKLLSIITQILYLEGPQTDIIKTPCLMDSEDKQWEALQFLLITSPPTFQPLELHSLLLVSIFFWQLETRSDNQRRGKFNWDNVSVPFLLSKPVFHFLY